MTLKEQILYRAKAILFPIGAALVGFVVWLVTNPDTATALEQIVPEPWVALVPVVLAGIAGTIAVHQTPIRTPTILTRTDGDDELVDDPTLDTRAVQTMTAGEDGVEAGGGPLMRTPAQARADYRRFFPDRDWNQSCQAAVAWLAKYTTGNVEFYLTARDAFEASQIKSRKPSKARLNDVHYWDIGTAGHVAVDLGNNRVLMASKHSDGSWGTNLGETTVEAYGHATGAVYLGFARSNGVNLIGITPPRKGGSARLRRNAAWLNRQDLGGRKTTTQDDGTVDQTGHVFQWYWWRVQTWGRKHGYYGAGYRIDGKVGTQTRKVEARINKLAKAAAAKK